MQIEHIPHPHPSSFHIMTAEYPRVGNIPFMASSFEYQTNLIQSNYLMMASVEPKSGPREGTFGVHCAPPGKNNCDMHIRVRVLADRVTFRQRVRARDRSQAGPWYSALSSKLDPISCVISTTSRA